MIDVTTTYREAIRTAKARAEVVKGIREIAAHYGATVTESEFQDAGKERNLKVALGPYAVRVVLDGRSRNDAFVCPWFTETREAKYPPEFIRVAGVCSINECHRGKATGIVYAVGGLFMMLTEGLEILAPLVAKEAALAALAKARGEG